MKDRDTFGLYDLVSPRYKILQEENPYLNIMQFHGSDGRSILRVHKKEEFGDDIASRRPMVAMVHRSHTIKTGFEGGIAGVAYRVIVPYTYNKVYLGALEFGIDIKCITDKIRNITGAETVFMLHEKRIAAADRNAYRIHYGEYYSIEQNSDQKKLIDTFADNNPKLEKKTISYEGRDYEIIPINVIANDGNLIGILFCINNISGYNDMKDVIFGSLIVGALIIAIFLSLYEYLYTLTIRKVSFQEEYISTILNSQKSIIVVTNGKNIIYVNTAFLEYFHYLDLNAFRKDYNCICDLFEKSDTETLLQPEMEGMRWTEYLIKHDSKEHKAKITMDGVVSIFSVNATKMEYADETRYVAVLSDITKLNLLATHDVLTSLPNRFEFDKVFDYSISISRRYERAFSLLLLDIDHFKQINDKHGHLAGDEVLKSFSDLLRKQIRESDFVARWGGEEFMILLPDTSLASAIKMADALRQRIEIHIFPTVTSITCSIGVAEFNLSEGADDLLKRVDEKLYAAKHGGRNRVMA